MGTRRQFSREFKCARASHPPPAVRIDSGMIVNAGLVTDAPAFTLLQSST